ncbi:RidA family protein [Daejeonella lutea]|uniref:Enamine deaminase RidA, house cleaning of reactive enamine intermediates, YjgF/YER057c/UK114 family n=1 Tax=Daejeonella lutea TaxID=572036 RepID=A0A1T5A6Z6_9SPHI|nr:RidA family protein [Daejeonella lutea]SKB30629.1 Enamine deaminase RidA, house cleaning of reactive enamine intermediates, YjgF/YER057c/UK114 family [Daejeonella lutea]
MHFTKKAGIILFSLLAVLNAEAQSVNSPIKYLSSSTVQGASDAVIVENTPLVHTKQVLPEGKNGSIVQDNFKAQTEQVFKNIAQSLEDSGSQTDHIVKLNVYLTNVNLISDFQSILKRRFTEGKQPAITYAIGELPNPRALIAIDAVAVSKSENKRVTLIGGTGTEAASSAILPAGPVVYVSGQAAKGDLKQATRATLTQLNETLTSLGLSMNDVVQIKSFLTPVSGLDIVKQQFAEFFKNEKIPPLVFVDWVSSDPVIEIELIASSHTQGVKNQQVDFITPPGMTSSPVYSKVSRLNYGKKVFLSAIHGLSDVNTDTEVSTLFDTMNRRLQASGSDFNHLLKATYYIDSDRYSKSLGDIRPKYYDPKRPPAASKAMLKGIGPDRSGISIDMIGTIKE